MFVDEALIHCAAGRGGKGCQSLDRSRPGHYRATGGDGGDGGSVILEAQPNIQTLLDFKMHRDFAAPNGGNGSSANKTGFCGQDLVIGVPAGTEVLDAHTGEQLSDLVKIGDRVVVCRGGAGGKGNDKRNDAEPGAEGEKKDLKLKLKLIADVGLIGFPNAGKSTLISRLSNARSKVAAYPFTTKSPVLGVVKFDDRALVLADIPGIIEGAHEGRGMGLDFLKHVERTRVLVHLVDCAGVDGRDPVEDVRTLEKELKQYSPKLAEKEKIMVANKLDVPEAKANLSRLKRAFRREWFPISAVTGEGLDALLNRLRVFQAGDSK